MAKVRRARRWTRCSIPWPAVVWPTTPTGKPVPTSWIMASPAAAVRIKVIVTPRICTTWLWLPPKLTRGAAIIGWWISWRETRASSSECSLQSRFPSWLAWGFPAVCPGSSWPISMRWCEKFPKGDSLRNRFQRRTTLPSERLAKNMSTQNSAAPFLLPSSRVPHHTSCWHGYLISAPTFSPHEVRCSSHEALLCYAVYPPAASHSESPPPWPSACKFFLVGPNTAYCGNLAITSSLASCGPVCSIGGCQPFMVIHKCHTPL